MELTKEQLIECAIGRLEAMRSALETELSPFEHSAMCVSIQLTEIALAELTAKPFMYGLKDGDGAPWFSEHCVSTNPAHLLDEQEEAEEEDGVQVVPLYLPNKLVEGLK